jgi:UDP-N-acetylmuramoylalanine--D-glutamate ligase
MALQARATEVGVPVISEVEVALRGDPAARLVVITGTNGKSTTTALLGHCLASAGIPVAIGGNIGDAACNLADPGQDGVIVLEMSSYQLETTPSLTPDISVLLNITPDHLNRHGGMDGYVAAKARALTALPAHGLAVIGSGDAHVVKLADDLRQGPAALSVISPEMAPAAVRDCAALAGDHNRENAAAVAACMQYLGCSTESIAAGMSNFAGLPHRLQPVAGNDHLQFINDSKATNGVAAARALAAFDNVYWIAGGQAKDDGLGAALDAAAMVRRAYLIGASAPAFAAALDGRCDVTMCGDLNTATHTAFADASADTGAAGTDTATILLSPAAASFDQFRQFCGARQCVCRTGTLSGSTCPHPENQPKSQPKSQGRRACLTVLTDHWLAYGGGQLTAGCWPVPSC